MDLTRPAALQPAQHLVTLFVCLNRRVVRHLARHVSLLAASLANRSAVHRVELFAVHLSACRSVIHVILQPVVLVVLCLVALKSAVTNLLSVVLLVQSALAGTTHRALCLRDAVSIKHFFKLAQNSKNFFYRFHRNRELSKLPLKQL